MSVFVQLVDMVCIYLAVVLPIPGWMTALIVGQWAVYTAWEMRKTRRSGSPMVRFF